MTDRTTDPTPTACSAAREDVIHDGRCHSCDEPADRHAPLPDLARVLAARMAREAPPLGAGTQVMATQMASGYEPPSMLLGTDPTPTTPPPLSDDDLDAIVRRANAALEWVRRGAQDGWLPLSVRHHFDADVPALVARVRQLEDALLAERETHRREHLERLAADRHAHSADKQIAHLTAVVARRDEELARLREREAQRHVEQCNREIAAIETTEEQS